MSTKHRHHYLKRRNENLQREWSEADDVSPSKRLRPCKQRGEPSRDRNVGFFLSRGLTDIWQRLNFRSSIAHFNISMFKKTLPRLTSDPIDLTEAEDKEVVNLAEDDFAGAKYEETENSVRNICKEESLAKSDGRTSFLRPPLRSAEQRKNGTPFNGSSGPPFSSTPFSDGQKAFVDNYSVLHDSTLPFKPLRGDVARPRSKPSSGKDRSSAAFSNIVPEMIDLDQELSLDGDGLDIIEAPPRTRSERLDQSLSGSCSSLDSFISEEPKPQFREKPKSYAAHEVVRLQEKAQYKILLEKMASRSAPPSVNKPKVIDIDLTRNDDNLFTRHTPYKKELLEKPVSEFVRKYYNPTSHFASPTSAVSQDEDPNDGIEVLEVKLPKYKKKQYKSSTNPMPDFFSPQWIKELKESITAETEKRKKIVEEQEKTIEFYRKRRNNRLEEEKLQLERIRASGAIVSEDKDIFPEITQEMERFINNVLYNGCPTDKVAQHLNFSVTRGDLKTLYNLNWLNDEVINFYGNLISERNKSDPSLPSMYIFNTFFYPRLKATEHKGVARWTRHIDIFSFDIVFFPLHISCHWALCVVDNRAKTIKYLDSMNQNERICLGYILEYLMKEKKAKKNIDMPRNEYTVSALSDKEIPQQQNGSDCGMFVLKYIDYLSRDKPLTFTQMHMPYFRRMMMYEIVTLKLICP